jgi:branched-chain amino acid transport system ATP-binding protein
METMAFILETRILSKYFGALQAINGVDFKLEKGEIRAIIGPNGAGKSTFFNLLTGIISPSGGDVFFHGEKITGLRPEQISQKGIARSYQITNIFMNLSAYENVRIAAQSKQKSFDPFRHYSSLKETDRQARVLLDTFQISSDEGVPASALSHGEQRRLEIAISLATMPSLLLLDEPTAGMSPTETDEIIKLIKNISRDLTVVIVEHDMKVVMQLAHKISVLYYGQILAEGSPLEIRNNDKVLEVYLGHN